MIAANYTEFRTALKDYLDSLDIPSTYIEYDYTEGALAPMRTRIEAFLETIT